MRILSHFSLHFIMQPCSASNCSTLPLSARVVRTAVPPPCIPPRLVLPPPPPNRHESCPPRGIAVVAETKTATVTTRTTTRKWTTTTTTTTTTNATPYPYSSDMPRPSSAKLTTSDISGSLGYLGTLIPLPYLWLDPDPYCETPCCSWEGWRTS